VENCIEIKKFGHYESQGIKRKYVRTKRLILTRVKEKAINEPLLNFDSVFQNAILNFLVITNQNYFKYGALKCIFRWILSVQALVS
jgi:hypothetical protein